MKIIKKYVRPFIAMALVCVILLGGQAILELMLPEYMSRIVNTGLQKGGIENTYPEIIPSDVFEVFTEFMTEEDVVNFENSYIMLKEAANKDKILEKYPSADENALVIDENADKAQLENLGKIFAKSTYAIYSLLAENGVLTIDTQAVNQNIYYVNTTDNILFINAALINKKDGYNIIIDLINDFGILNPISESI